MQIMAKQNVSSIAASVIDLKTVVTHEPMRRADSEAQLDELQSQLLAYQQTIFKHQHRIVIVFEGADAAGKGGTIARLTHKLDPRGVYVYPIGAPSSKELTGHYLQRFWPLFPRGGQITIFDRSWYGRVLVERVDQLVSETTWRRAYDEINQLEKWLVDDGTIIVKFFMHLSQEQQKIRLIERIQKPDKRWKLTQADLDAYEQFDDYTDAWSDMLAYTNTPNAPWLLIPADNKHAARVNVLTSLLAILAERVPKSSQRINPALAKSVKKLFGNDVLE